jgi:hypothetical protein
MMENLSEHSCALMAMRDEVPSKSGTILIANSFKIKSAPLLRALFIYLDGLSG